MKRVFSEKLQLQREIEVEQAHRTGKPVLGSDRPRPIVVKSAVLQRANSLRETKIYINEDYTDPVRLKRKELLPKLRAARDRGDIAFLRQDKLIIHPCSSTPKQPRDV